MVVSTPASENLLKIKQAFKNKNLAAIREKIHFLSANDLNSKCLGEYTLLIGACSHKDEDFANELVSLLLNQENIDVNKLCNGATALWLACRNYKTEIVSLLLKHPKIDINISDPTYGTPFYIACKFDNFRVVKLLLQHPGIDINKTADENRTPFFGACEAGNSRIVELLLTDFRTDFISPDAQGRTPLFIACEKNKTTVIKSLLKDSRIDVNSTDSQGRSPLEICKMTGFEMVMKNPRISRENWNNLLHAVVKNDLNSSLNMFSIQFDNFEKFLMVLVHPQVRLNIKNKENHTPFYLLNENQLLEPQTKLAATTVFLTHYQLIRKEKNFTLTTLTTELGYPLKETEENLLIFAESKQWVNEIRNIIPTIIPIVMTLQKLAAQWFLLMVLISDGYLKTADQLAALWFNLMIFNHGENLSPSDKRNIDILKFISICNKLSLDLKMILSNRIVGLGNCIIPPADVNAMLELGREDVNAMFKLKNKDNPFLCPCPYFDIGHYKVT